MKITCFGGVGEIGGNKILLEDRDRRFLLDFGKAFGEYSRFFDGIFVKERVARGLLDPLALGLLPPLRGLLREDLVPAVATSDLQLHPAEPQGPRGKPRQAASLRASAVEAFWEHWRQRRPLVFRDLRRGSAPAVDLVLLSHAHQDHISDLAFVSHEIPVVATRTTAFIAKVLGDVGIGGIGGVPYIVLRTPGPEGALQAQREEPYRTRPHHFVDGAPEGHPSGDPLENASSFWANTATKTLAALRAEIPADVRFLWWPVDHSLLGAAGYAVETEAGWVAYTGDLRFHGSAGRQTWDFAEALAALRPAVLICEGTRLSATNSLSEAEVGERCLEAAHQADGRLLVADFAPRNIERLMAFLRIAAETGRRLLVQPKDAYLLRAMYLANPDQGDVMRHASIGLYADPKVTHYEWERLVYDRFAGQLTRPEWVHSSPGDYLLAFSLTDVPDLLDLEYLAKGPMGGVYIFSNSQAYDEEQMVDLVRLWNWASHLGLEMVGLAPSRHGSRGEVSAVSTVAGYHASGHASGAELAEFVRRVHPRALVAVHTEEPLLWSDHLAGTGIQLVNPEYARPIQL